MTNSMNLFLPDELRRYVNERTSDSDVYATPSDYISDLIRRDMQERSVAIDVMNGVQDVKDSRFSTDSIHDIKNESQS